MSAIESDLLSPADVQTFYVPEQIDNPIFLAASNVQTLLEKIAASDQRIQREKEYMTDIDSTDPPFVRVKLRFGDKTGLYGEEVETIDSLSRRKLSFLEFIRYYPLPDRIVAFDCREVVVSIGPNKTFVIGEKPTMLTTQAIKNTDPVFLSAVDEAITHPGEFYEEYLRGRDF